MPSYFALEIGFASNVAARQVGILSKVRTALYFVPILEQIRRGGWMLHRNPFSTALWKRGSTNVWHPPA